MILLFENRFMGILGRLPHIILFDNGICEGIIDVLPALSEHKCYLLLLVDERRRRRRRCCHASHKALPQLTTQR